MINREKIWSLNGLQTDGKSKLEAQNRWWTRRYEILFVTIWSLKKCAPGKYSLEGDCLNRNPVLEPNGEEKLKFVNLMTTEDIKEDQMRNERYTQIKIN